MLDVSKTLRQNVDTHCSLASKVLEEWKGWASQAFNHPAGTRFVDTAVAIQLYQNGPKRFQRYENTL